MSRKTKIIRFVLSIGVLILLFAICYKYEHSMDRAEEFQVNSPNYKPKLLSATHGSEFKNTLTQILIENYKQDSTFINVIGLFSLSKINPIDYNAILLIHTWGNWRPPVDIETFIKKTGGYKDKIIVFTTSGQGTFKMDEVDAITGESKLENVTVFSNKIIEKLNPKTQ
jgi:hypothetical protein